MALDPEVVAEVLDVATRRPATLDYFLESINSPEWIPYLRERGLFNDPPKQRVDEEGLVRAPSWAQSRYLARVASVDPGSVLAVIKSITTNNERVVEDFADAALAMPVEWAAQIAPLLTRFVHAQEHLYYLLPRKLVDLAVHLLQEGAAEAAVPLLRALFRPEAVANDDYWRPRTRPRFSEWEYDMRLRKIVEEALPHSAELILTCLVRLLEEALELIRVDAEDVDSDGSRAWRVRIGGDRDRGTDLEESLVSAVRDAAVLAREQALLEDEEVVGVLTRFGSELYRRIAMFALASGPEPDGLVARGFALKVSELTHYEPSPEYQALLKRIAPSLTGEEIASLLEAIWEGRMSSVSASARRSTAGAPRQVRRSQRTSRGGASVGLPCSLTHCRGRREKPTMNSSQRTGRLIFLLAGRSRPSPAPTARSALRSSLRRRTRTFSDTWLNGRSPKRCGVTNPRSKASPAHSQ